MVFSIFAFFAVLYPGRPLQRSQLGANLTCSRSIPTHVRQELRTRRCLRSSPPLQATVGFLDNLFDIHWGTDTSHCYYFAADGYYAKQGNTHVVVPIPLRLLFGVLVNIAMYVSIVRTMR